MCGSVSQFKEYKSTGSYKYAHELGENVNFVENFYSIISAHKIDYLDGKASAYNAGDWGSIAGSGRSPGEENGTPLQYSCLENPMEGGAW